MKFKWYYADNIKGTEETWEEAVDALNSHLDFDITDIHDYKAEQPSPFHRTMYFYPNSMSDEEIQNDDGAHTPQIDIITMRD